MAFGDPQIDQKTGHGFGSHCGSPISMQSQLTWQDVLACHDVGNQLLRQFCTLAWSDQPVHDKAAEDVQNHVEAKASPLGRPLQFGDVSRPNLVGCIRQQFRLGVGRMAQLVAPLGAAGCGLQQSVYCARRAKVEPLVEQGGMTDKPFNRPSRTIGLSNRLRTRANPGFSARVAGSP